jgi:hypothetical protein
VRSLFPAVRAGSLQSAPVRACGVCRCTRHSRPLITSCSKQNPLCSYLLCDPSHVVSDHCQPKTRWWRLLFLSALLSAAQFHISHHICLHKPRCSPVPLLAVTALSTRWASKSLFLFLSHIYRRNEVSVWRDQPSPLCSLCIHCTYLFHHLDYCPSGIYRRRALALTCGTICISRLH